MRLRLGPRPNVQNAKLTINIPEVLKDKLVVYAAAQAAEYSQQPAEIDLLIVQIVEHFIAKDRAFQKVLRSRSAKPSEPNLPAR